MNVRPTHLRPLPRLRWPGGADAPGVPAGTGGGTVVSHGHCLARLTPEGALAAAFGRGRSDPRWRRPQGLARALLAWIESGGHAGRAIDRFDEADDGPAAQVPQRLAAWLETPPGGRWPDWVPAGAFALALGGDPAEGIGTAPPGPLTDALADPHLVACLAARIRGPLFLRGAAPDVGQLLDWWPGRGPWELWRPEPVALPAPAAAGLGPSRPGARA